MQHLTSLILGVLIALYGLLNAFAGFSQLKAKEIQVWAAWRLLEKLCQIFKIDRLYAIQLCYGFLIMA
jgi:hypothetical protein